MGRGSHERGDLADAPESMPPVARAARVELRSCVVAAADVVDAAPNDEDAANKLLRCARALSTAAADLHPIDGEDAPSTAAAARVMKDAGGFIWRALKGGLCPAASTATAGLGLLRAEFVRRGDAQQVWVDGVDCCVVPPFRQKRTQNMTRRRRRPHRRTAAAVDGEDDQVRGRAADCHRVVLLAQRCPVRVLRHGSL